MPNKTQQTENTDKATCQHLELKKQTTAGRWHLKLKRVVLPLVMMAMCGCAKKVIHAPVAAYHFAYCDHMNPDGKHCDRWATECGTLDCKQ